ncbi:MAG: hypothetical protein QXQ60_06480 [Thermofilum sp.]
MSWYRLDVPAHQEKELEGLATALQTPFLLWNTAAAACEPSWTRPPLSG